MNDNTTHELESTGDVSATHDSCCRYHLFETSYRRQLQRYAPLVLNILAVIVLSGVFPQQSAMACAIGQTCGGGPPPPPSCPTLPAAGAYVVLSSDHTVSTPATAVFDGKLYLAWTGNNESHSIIVSSSCNGLDFGTNVVTNFTTNIAGPGLAEFGGNLWLAWANAGNHQIEIASSTDGLIFGAPYSPIEGLIQSSTGLTLETEQSYAGVHLAAANGLLYAAWAGIDGAHTLQTSFTSAPNQSWSDAVIGTVSLLESSPKATSSGVTATAHSCTVYTVGCVIANVVNNIGNLNFSSGSSSVLVDGPAMTVGPSSNLIMGAVVFAPDVPGQYISNTGYINVVNGIVFGGGSLESVTTLQYQCRTTGNALADGDCDHVTANSGIGLATLDGVLYLAWVPAGQKDIYISKYDISGTGDSAGDYTPVGVPENTGHPCDGQPDLVTFDGNVYMYWMGTNAGTNVLAELIT